MTKETKLLRLILKYKLSIFLFCFFGLMYLTNLVIHKAEIEYSSRKIYTTTMEMADPTTEGWVRMIYLDGVSSDFVKSFESVKSLSNEFGLSEVNSENVSRFITDNLIIKYGASADYSILVKINHNDKLTPNLIIIPILDIARAKYFNQYENIMSNRFNINNGNSVIVSQDFINGIINKVIYKNDYIKSIKTIDNGKNYFDTNKIVIYFGVSILFLFLYVIVIYYIKTRLIELEITLEGKWSFA